MSFRPCYLRVGALPDPDCVAVVLAALALASYRAQAQHAYSHPEDWPPLVAHLVARLAPLAARAEDDAR
jgi:hypothetical protein